MDNCARSEMRWPMQNTLWLVSFIAKNRPLEGTNISYLKKERDVYTRIISYVFVLFFTAPLSACAQMKVRNETRANKATPPECIISPSEREALLSLDYNSFDQSLPNGGWRKYDHCPKLARELLDEYTIRHEAYLQKQQWDVLVWHSGQISAIAGDYLDAISKMEKTIKPNEKPTDAFLWNPYARATIAFLRRDKALLLSEREKLARGLSPFNRINLRKVDSFVALIAHISMPIQGIAVLQNQTLKESELWLFRSVSINLCQLIFLASLIS